MAVSVCRVCLAANTKMHNIRDTRLEEVFEKVTSDKLSAAQDGRPQSICYLCCSELERCRRFLDIFMKTDLIFGSLAHRDIQLTPETLRILNQKIPPSLTVSPTEVTAISKYTQYSQVAVKSKFTAKRELEENQDGGDEDEPIAKKPKIEPLDYKQFSCSKCSESSKLEMLLTGHICMDRNK